MKEARTLGECAGHTWASFQACVLLCRGAFYMYNRLDLPGLVCIVEYVGMCCGVCNIYCVAAPLFCVHVCVVLQLYYLCVHV